MIEIVRRDIKGIFLGSISDYFKYDRTSTKLTNKYLYLLSTKYLVNISLSIKFHCLFNGIKILYIAIKDTIIYEINTVL